MSLLKAIGIVSLILILVSVPILYNDNIKRECKSEDSFSIQLQIRKLCTMTDGGSFTYTTNPLIFNGKECEVKYKC